jgi:hypothetical protein
MPVVGQDACPHDTDPAGPVFAITLLAHERAAHQPLPVRTAAWYYEADATFADVIAFARRAIWGRLNCMRSTSDPDWVLIPRRSTERLMDTLCYAA